MTYSPSQRKHSNLFGLGFGGTGVINWYTLSIDAVFSQANSGVSGVTDVTTWACKVVMLHLVVMIHNQGGNIHNCVCVSVSLLYEKFFPNTVYYKWCKKKKIKYTFLLKYFCLFGILV